MSPTIIGTLGLGLLFVFLAAGMPIGFAMALAGFVGYVAVAGLTGALTYLGTVPYTSVASYIMSVIPLFVLMGEVASSSKMTEGAYRSMHTWLGGRPGGLAMATVGGCAAFAAVCGSSMATALTMSSVALPEMNRHKYDPRLSLGAIAAGGTLGILIPPSIVFVIYGVFAEESIGRLFLSGFFPGILLASLFVFTIYVITRIRPSWGPPGPKGAWGERLVAAKGIWPVLVLALVVLGGIWGGVFSATEAGAVGAFGALAIGFARKTLGLQAITASLRSGTKTTAMVFTIIIGAMIFNYFIVATGLPRQMAAFVEALGWPPMGVIGAILVVYVILGALMDIMAMTVLTLPIFIPLIRGLGFDTVWFGTLFVIMCEMALITPPIGLNVFVIGGVVKDVPMYTIFRGIVPFLLAMIVTLILVVTFPQIALFLPNTMIGKTP